MKKLNKNIIFKWVIGLLVFVILLELLNLIFGDKSEELKKEYIDKYNFKQLEKVKVVLKDLKREDKQFFNLKEFNELYSQDIKPVKNCYYIRNYKNIDRVSYTFGFKLESNKYINKYGTGYYVYPKYDLPYQRICYGGPGNKAGCDDRNRLNFEYTISIIT